MSIGPIASNIWYGQTALPASSQLTGAQGAGSSDGVLTASTRDAGGPSGASGVSGVKDCPMCESRRYVDGSSDPGVSFKSPTRLPAGSAASLVRSHEQEHVSRQAAKARESGGKVISQTVTVETSVCPNCGRAYVSGGRTRTVMSVPAQTSPATQSSQDKGSHDLGSRLDMRL